MIKTKAPSLTPEKLEASRIPQAFWGLSAPDFFGRPAVLQKINRYCDRITKARTNGVGLLLRGGLNSGKTFLATYVLRAALLEAHSAKYYTLAELTTLMMGQEGSRFFDEIVRPDFLAVDDLDDMNEGSRLTLGRIIRRRKDEGKPLLLCTIFPASKGDTDLLERKLGDDARRLFDVTLTIACAASEFRTHDYYAERKKAVR